MIKTGSNSIGKVYLGSNKIGKAYLGSNLVFQSGASPSPSSNIPYIRGGADGSYIDTGIKPDSTTRVIVWARNWNPNGGALFGGRTALDNAMFSIGAYSGASGLGAIRVDYDSSHTTYTDDQFSNLGCYHKYELDKGVLKIDDDTVITVSGGAFSSTSNLCLLGNNNGGTHMNTNSPIDICACEIYKDGTLVRDFTAVSSPSVGLYDAISGTVFTNAGIGSITYGEFDKNAFVPLEYINCDGNQYFDSGVRGGYSTQIISKFRYTTNSSNVGLVGFRGTSDWCEFCINYGSTIAMIYRLASDANWRNLCNVSSGNFLDQDIVLQKLNTNSASIYKNKVQIGTTISPTSSTSYISSGNLFVGALNYHDERSFQQYTGRIYYMGIGTSRAFHPAKKGNIVGMYDTYNDVFYPSETETPFIAGPEL